MSHRRTSPKIFSNARELRHQLTDAEDRLWQVLRMHRPGGIHFRRQHAIGGYIVDFCAARKKLVIEVDGEQHLDQQDYDLERTAFLEAKGYRVLRFWNNEVLENQEAVLQLIFEALENDSKE